MHGEADNIRYKEDKGRRVYKLSNGYDMDCRSEELFSMKGGFSPNQLVFGRNTILSSQMREDKHSCLEGGMRRNT